MIRNLLERAKPYAIGAIVATLLYAALYFIETDDDRTPSCDCIKAKPRPR